MIFTPEFDDGKSGIPLCEYPRPQFKRDSYFPLNGEWDYAITPLKSSRLQSFDGKILVPFPVESQLSGVERTVGPDSVLWYARKFRIPSKWKGDDVLLNFGAVDWKAEVWIRRAKRVARFIQFPEKNFTDILSQKLKSRG